MSEISQAFLVSSGPLREELTSLRLVVRIEGVLFDAFLHNL